MKPNEPLLLGYFAEGGIGSHPAIFTESELTKLGFIQGLPKYFVSDGVPEEIAKNVWYLKSDELINFWCTNRVSSLPGALVCAFNEDYLWDIRGISHSLGQEIIDLIGGDTIDNEDNRGNDYSLLNQVENLIGLPQTRRSVTLITIIPNPTPNKVYWSDEPERSHSYWCPPYKPMTFEELINQLEP